MVDRQSPVPLYYQLKQQLRRQIESGELHAGDRLPTEAEMCDIYAISRAPVRQALVELASEGLIYRRAGQGTFVSPHANAALESTTHLRILSHYDMRWMASVEQATRAWNRQNPDQPVELEVTMCSYDDFHPTLRRSVAEGTAPDLAPLDVVWVADYAYASFITPLSSLDAVWARAAMEAFEAPVVKNNCAGGNLYAVPVQSDITGLWYRRDWLAEAGATVPTTWAEWLSLIDVFAQPEVRRRFGHEFSLVLPVTAAATEATVNLLIPFIWMTGGDVLDSAGRLCLDCTAVREALGFLQKITLERRYALPDMTGARVWDLARYFAKGLVPMALGGSYDWPRIQDECAWAETPEEAVSHLGFAMAPRPSVDCAPISSLGGTSWAITRQSSHQELCLEILKLASRPELSHPFCKENLQVSPLKSVNSDFMREGHPWLSTVTPLLRYARTRPSMRNYVQVSLYLQRMFELILWEGAPVEETVRHTAHSLELLI